MTLPDLVGFNAEMLLVAGRQKAFEENKFNNKPPQASICSTSNNLTSSKTYGFLKHWASFTVVHWEGWGGQRGQNRRQKQHEQQQVSFNNISFCTIRHKKINTFPFKLQSESFLVFGTAVEMRLHVLDAAGLWWEV